jgi:hypothetical protein
VRIAFSGTHAVGKSTLIADVHKELPAYAFFVEPYYHLLDEGHIFADAPSADDFLRQLERSIVSLSSERATDTTVARRTSWPISASWTRMIPFASGLVPQVTLSEPSSSFVFVPVEQPDRSASAAGVGRLRRTVDVHLREMLLEDSYGFDLPIIRVHGPATARVRHVVAAMEQRASALPRARSNRS